MTWAEFITAVKQQLGSDATRLGSAPTLIQRYAANAVLDLQESVYALRSNHQTQYALGDLTVSGVASQGTMPSGAHLREAYVVSETSPCCRTPVSGYPGGWENRFDLTCGHPRIFSNFWMAINSDGTEFLLYPAIVSGLVLHTYWDGLKSSFEDTDDVAFGELKVIEAVALYTKAMLAREIPENIPLYSAYMGTLPMPSPGTYLYARKHLFLAHKNQGEMDTLPDAPQLGSSCSSLDCTVSATVTEGVASESMGWFFRDTLVQMRAIPSVATNKICVLGGELVLGDENGGFYRWDNEGTAPDNTYIVVRPDDFAIRGKGLWRKFA